MSAYQNLFGVAYPPSQVLDVSIGLYNSRRKFNTEHLMDGKDDSFGVLAISLYQATEAFFDRVWSDIWITIKAISYNR